MENEKKNKPLNQTNQIVRYAMKMVAKDVRPPKCVRDGIVKINKNQQE